MRHLYKNAIAKLKTYQYKHINVRLILWVVSLTILGINIIASARPDEPSFYKKQIFGFMVGLTGMVIIALFDYHFVLKFYWLIFIVNVGLLLAVRFVGASHMGAKRWIEFGNGSLQIQPSEFAKIFIVLFFAKFLYVHKDKINSFKIVASSIVFIAAPLILIYKQPDLSTSIVIILLFCVIMFIAGISYKWIFGVIAVMIPVFIVLVYMLMQPNQKILEEYQFNRIVGFFDEDNEDAQKIRWQQDNAEMAIGSGGLWGKGLNNDSEDSVKNGNYIPEPQTDFIFAIAGEELGFVGTTAIIIMLLLIVFECFYTGAHAPDLAGRIICCGIGGYLGIQSFINICVVTNMIPNTGLPLPFVSYGLSSLLSSFAGIGFVINVGMQRAHRQKLDAI